MNALSLFSGIGGLDIASERAGFKTVAFCERDEFCQKVLRKHWPNVRIFDDVRTIDTSELPRIELLHGGYPCQPFSVAGLQQGIHDSRHVWPEMFKTVQRMRPTWVVAENVKGHIALGLDDVLRDLERTGYTARPFVIPACAIGANHTRERVFVVAYATNDGRYDGSRSGCTVAANDNEKEGQNEAGDAERCSRVRAGVDRYCAETWGGRTKPGIRRIHNGVPNRMDRLKSLGNAVVPQQAYPIFAAIAETYNVKLTSGVSAAPKPE